MKNSILSSCCITFLLLFSQYNVCADFNDIFTSTDSAWQVDSVASPSYWGFPAYQQSLEVSVSSAEFNSSYPVEGVSRAVNPVYFTNGSTWTVSAGIDGGTTPANVPASKELWAQTAHGSYAIGLLAGASSRSLGYSPTNGHMIDIWNDITSSWTNIPYVSGNGLFYSGNNIFTISYAGNGVVNYYLNTPTTGNILIFTQTGMDASDTGISDLESTSLDSFNFDAGGYNAFWRTASATTIQAQAQTYTLNIATNPPNGGIISGAGVYNAGTFIGCNIQASNGWYVSNIQYSGSLQGSDPSQAFYNATNQINFDPSTITDYNAIIQLMTSDGTLSVSFATLAPTFNQQPASQGVITGSGVMLSGEVGGRQPISYQWQFNGSNIIAATNSSLVFNAVQLTNAGAYTLVASNAFGITTNSIPAVLSVVDIGIFADWHLVSGQTYSAPNYSYITFESIYPDGYIFYTLDGSDPGFTANEYTGPFYIYNSSTIRAIAYNANFSEYVEANPAVINILPSYQLSILNYGGGTVSVNPPSEDGQNSYGYYSYNDYLSNSIVTLVATASAGSAFMGWSGSLIGTNLTNTITVNQDTSVQAIFGTSLNPTNIGNGTLAVYPATTLYPYGYTVQITATPGQSNCFVQWSGAAAGSENPFNLTITTANSTITGIFTALPTNKVSLTVLSDGGGYVTVNPSANIYLKGTTNILTAFANSGQNFIGWSGDATNTTNVISVVMDKSKSITAHFSHFFSQKFTKSGTNLQFSISGGVSGNTYQILTSTNLSTWIPMATNVDFFEPVLFFDSIDKTVPYRFYKTLAK